MSPRLQGDDLAHLRRLPELLLRAGYVDAYCVYGFLHLRFPQVRRELAALPEPLRTLVVLFLLGDPVAPAALRGVLSAELQEALLRQGILIAAGDHISTAGLILLPLLGQMMFVPRPDAGNSQLDEEAVLSARLTPPRGASCLSLSAGNGMEAMRCIALADRVLAIEVNPILVACLELSVALNAIEDRAEVRQGDLYTALAPGETFDYVVASPPVLPFPPGLLTASADPSDDGTVVFRRLLEGLPPVLRPGGWAQFLVCGVGDESGPKLGGEISTFARERDMRAIVTVPARLRLHPGDRLFEAMAQGGAAACDLDVTEVRNRLREHFRAAGVDYLYAMAVTLSPAPGRGGATQNDHFLAPGGFWFK